MTDKELADKIVALGGGTKVHRRYAPPNAHPIFEAYGFVRDWRVAGALMEKIHEAQYSLLVMQMPDAKPMVTVQAPIVTAGEYADPSQRRKWAAQVVGESLPRAINEAYVEALS